MALLIWIECVCPINKLYALIYKSSNSVTNSIISKGSDGLGTTFVVPYSTP